MRLTIALHTTTSASLLRSTDGLDSAGQSETASGSFVAKNTSLHSGTFLTTNRTRLRCPNTGILRSHKICDEEKDDMKNSRRQYARVLANLRQGTKQAARAWEEHRLGAQEQHLCKAIDTSLSACRRAVELISRCLPLISFVEEGTKSIVNAGHPTARDLCALAEAADLIECHIAEYKALLAGVDPLGSSGVLLETCLTETRRTLERTRLLIRPAEMKLAPTRSRNTDLAA